MSDEEWSEDDSETYQSLSHYAVPERERQIAIAVALVQSSDAPGGILDLCSGEGLMTQALGVACPEAELFAYDGSASMLATARRRVGERLVTRQIDIAALDWRTNMKPLRAVVSSLAVHHLDGAGKRRLFSDLWEMLAPGGVFVLADLVRPQTEAGWKLAADMWDEETRRRALGASEAFRRFEREEWNLFRHGIAPGSIDHPSTLVEQLQWLEQAGFRRLDMHWMLAGQVLLSAWRER